MRRTLADEEPSPTEPRRRGQRSTRRLALAVVAVLGASAIAWFARDLLRATKLAAPTTSTRAGGEDSIPATASGAAEAAVNPPGNAVTQRNEETREATAAAPPADASAVVIAGRILDERRRPVAGCDVTLLRVGAAATHARSDDEGRFILATARLDAVDRKGTSLYALAADGRCAVAWVDLTRSREDESSPGDPLDAGDLIAAPGGRLRVGVVDERGPVADVALELGCGDDRRRAPPATSGADGGAEWPALPPGTVRVRAFSADARSGVASGELAAGHTLELELRLGPTRAVDVVVCDEKGRPIEGTHVAVLEDGAFNRDPGRGFFVERNAYSLELPLATAPTDAAGRTRIAALPKDVAGWLRAERDGCEMSGSDRWPTWRPLPLADGVTRVELGLRAPTPNELRWHVRAGAAPVPPEGSTIRIALIRNTWQSEIHPPARGVIKDGNLVVASSLVGSVLTAWAIAPDDSIALIEDPRYSGNADTISFAPGRRLTVTVRDVEGCPVRGARITEMIEDKDQREESKFLSSARTDANGVARFFPLLPSRRIVLVERTPEGSPPVRIGVVDLTQGDVALEKTLPAPRAATLAFEIDGERRLPQRYTLRGPLVGGRARREDPAHGEVQIDLEEPGAPVPQQIFVEAPGFRPCEVIIPATTGASEPFVVVPLERGGTLVARILSTPSDPPRPHLERLDAATGRFAPLRGSPEWIQSPNDGPDRYEFTALAPGRYRVADGVRYGQIDRSYVASDAVDVTVGATAYVELDLRRMKKVRVTIAVPDGEDASNARVLIVGNGDEAPWRSEHGIELPGIAPSGGRDVELQVDETHALRLRAWHPWLVAAPEGGEAVVDGTHDAVTLVLTRAPLLTFALPEGAASWKRAFVTWTPAGGGAGAGGAAWAFERDGRFRFGPPPTGHWDVLIDCDPLAPLWLRDVAWDGDARDLGVLPFTRGASIRIVAADPNAPLPPLYVWASTRGEPKCVRVARPGPDGAPVVVTGLPAGTVDVTVRDYDTYELYASEAIELDGITTRDLLLRGR
jgi:hypothetical protein